VQLISGLELVRKVPLALIRSVVALSPQHVADGGYVSREIIGPREIGVVEHTVFLDVLAGVEDSTRRRANTRGYLMILKQDASRCQLLMPR